jgi:RecB family endonuclease NucS
VARNTYIRVGAVELHRHSQTVFMACYYRYYRFFPNGQVGAAPARARLAARPAA